MVWDVPWNVTKLATKDSLQVNDRVWKNLLPGRCLDSGLRHLLQGFGVLDEGGIFCLPRLRADDSEKSEISSEEERGGIPDEDGIEEREGEKHETLGEGERNDETSVLDASLKRLGISRIKQKLQAKLEAPLTKRSTQKARAKEARNLEGNPNEPSISTSPELAAEKASNLQSNPNKAKAKEETNVNATKSDDAEVQVRKWNTGLAKKLA
jgi:hypothetical protein